MECINIREHFGDKYRIRREEPAATFADPWTHFIPCKYGQIYPHGGEELGFSSSKRGGVAHRLAKLPFTTVIQSGDDGMNIVFHVRHFNEVAAMVQARRRMVLSDAERQRRADVLKANRSRENRGFSGEECTQGTQGDSESAQPFASDFGANYEPATH